MVDAMLWSVREILTATVSFILIVAVLLRYLKSRRNVPPGPRGLPILGSVLSMGGRPDLYLNDMAKIYGPVMSVNIGPRLNVILNDVDAAKEAFLKQGEVFSGRSKLLFFDVFVATILGDARNLNHGVVLSTGKLWKEQRKFSLEKLREFGMGRVSLEEKIKEEVSCLLAELKSTNSQAFDMQTILMMSVCNVISSIVFGNRFEYDDEQFKILLKALSDQFALISVAGVLNFIPWLQHFPPFNARVKEAIHNDRVIVDVLMAKREAHIADFDNDNIRDFIDAYLSEIKSERAAGRQTTSFSESELLFVVADLFGGGTETTTTTLRWAMLFMLKHPTVCQKVQTEIDEVIGRGRMACMADKKNMPYTEATITEVQRLGNIAPLGVPHLTLEEVEFGGYTIPANTPVIANMTAILRDPAHFPNPDIFDPERFLDEEGRFVKNEAMIPFSIGRRVCLGESIARMELFLFFTSILQNFDIKLAAGAPEPSFDGILGLTWMPMPSKICLPLRE
ncbi:PREDICTED: cytochrome P450 2C15-like [Priapulus caudatus]|uniref:Cytochrome P450 2C15-like n=1 Tax=Priapulus caudatus TaxID=37621 RepID=A0ABM1EXA9_PRICU|nr:PREDICTED: cytochrome P450 2C15-like [Priapulus caudatus]